MGGRAQAPSLVQGLRPRNAPLGLPTMLVLLHHCGMPTVRPNQPGGCQPNTPLRVRMAAKMKRWSVHIL